ncbi:MAG: N-acetylmuramoyl-L-alanine amidase family protein, partial [Gemmatimonadaceae bacterium]
MRTLRFAVIAFLVGCQSAPTSTQASSTSAPSPQPVPRPAPPVSPPTVATFERGITPRPAPPLPPIPLVEGPLAPKLVFPAANQTISVRDSNFIFGSVGNGHATLTINGAPVDVAPNGTFLAYLPVPPPTAPRYDVVARNGADSVRLVVPVRVPPARPDLSLTGRLVVDSSSVSPAGTSHVLRDDEPLRVSVRAPANATAWVTMGGVTYHLVNTGGNLFATDVPFLAFRAGGTLFVARGREMVRFTMPKLSPLPPAAHFVTLGDPALQADTDATVIGRPTPAGTYKWMFVPGTIVQETGRSGADIRVRLDSQLEVWVDSVRDLPPGTPSPRRVVGAMSLTPAPEWVDLVMPVSSPPPYLIEQEHDRIVLTLYGTQASPETIKFLQNDSLVRMINWIPEQSDRVRFSLELSQPAFGYLVLFDPARGFVLRIRRPPRVSLAHPLEGLTITVDPGHPPGGAIGPTGLTEAAGVLPVAMKLKQLLEERGARVVLTRTTMDAVDLHLRSVIAR